MKKFLIVLMTALSLLGTTSSFAHGWHGGGYGEGYRGCYHGGYGYGFAPFVAGALLGGAVVGSTYSSSAPIYYSSPVVVAPQTVYVQPQMAMQSVPVQPHAYYCASAQNYYPYVQTCDVPWQQTN